MPIGNAAIRLAHCLRSHWYRCHGNFQVLVHFGVVRRSATDRLTQTSYSNHSDSSARPPRNGVPAERAFAQRRTGMAVQGERVIGIDLGTTNSVVSVMEGGECKVIANLEGNRITPSVVAFPDKGEILVGEPAKRQAGTHPRNTVYSIKRFMGRRHHEVETEEKMVPYGVTGGAGDYVKVKAGGKEYTPPEISALILRKLKEAAESYLGHKINKAVIT